MMLTLSICCHSSSYLQHMLGSPLTYEDIEGVDPEYYKNLAWMLEHDITDVLDLTFTAESDFFGKKEVCECCTGNQKQHSQAVLSAERNRDI